MTHDDLERPLPEPESPEVAELFSNREVREAYRFLYERRDDPPTMTEWREEARGVFGRANEQLDRRLREVRKHFVVIARPAGGEWVYELAGWKSDAVGRRRRISPRLEAEVFAKKGAWCAMCGRRPGEDGVKLEIDHIVPESWGGETVFQNLEPLCVEHNHGKQAFFASLSEYKSELAHALKQPTAWERIGELLKALAKRDLRTPAELVAVAARETHKGDPKRRLRDLRVVLGWDIVAHKRKSRGVTFVEYELRSYQPWPSEGAAAVINRYERERRRRKAQGLQEDDDYLL